MLIYDEVTARANLIHEKINFSWKALGDGSWPFTKEYFLIHDQDIDGLAFIG